MGSIGKDPKFFYCQPTGSYVPYVVTHRFGAGTTPELRERFRFVDNPPSAETFNALLPQLSYAEERATGREYLLKLWRKAIHFLRPREQTAFQMRNRLQAGTRRNCTSG
jgi:hypothetical protein